MSEHYYSNRPSVEHQEKEFVFELRDQSLKFITDAGVFSRDRIDYGSVLLIEEMQIQPKDEVLDMGCGYGPIGLVAARLASKGKVWMADVNERAVTLAQRNAERNGIHNVEIMTSFLFENLPDQKYDVILTNPPIRAGKQTVHQIFEEAYPRLKDTGSLWIVIQKKQGGPSAMSKLQEIYQKVEKVVQDKGYWIIKATRLDHL
ncbi:class I SAM-dependent methyltransferase [Ammoniphilus sp. CFH 90114]|uniref:class I SAM-dependent methyltransferase n=1 Tax=Ammoniphilus sp. CFH 90114 TaxID=2493665 RepID=UPI00100EFBE9|nr:class I SAM-dependent methyltransferase [Ammoniphilus sp. CFH 90114]RXT09066.1 class I SAM-dependent methyltransferase [Ammoniphilus sp. CFH 90114]